MQKEIEEKNNNVSRFNAVKHGILKQVVSEYEQDAYEEITTALESEFEPVGALERMLVDRIGICLLRLHRAAKAENEFMRATLDPRVVSIKDYFGSMPKEEVVEKEGYTPKVGDVAVSKLVDTYLRYETTIENRLYKALHELQRAQAIRGGEKVAPPLSIDVGMSREE